MAPRRQRPIFDEDFEDDEIEFIREQDASTLPAMGVDPLEGMGELLGTLYPSPEKPEKRSSVQRGKPEHYKVICISLYKEDLDKLDALVDALKAQGHTRVSRSQLIRFALTQVDLAKFPRRL